MKPSAEALRGCVGETLGTFIVVFFGCGAVAAAVLTGAQVGLFQVAIIWGFGVATAIHVAGSLSGAHLNPAITIAMAVWSDFPMRRVLPFIAWQLLGAFFAAATVYLMFRGAFASFELHNHLLRGMPGSEASAMVFCEFFPNPGGKPLDLTSTVVTLPTAVATEVIGTAILALTVMCCCDERNASRPQLLTATIIGVVIVALVSVMAPLTMACLNPARDLGPRLFSALAGWGALPFRVNGQGWWAAYIAGPIVGAQLGGGIYHVAVKRLYAKEDAREAMATELIAGPAEPS